MQNNMTAYQRGRGGAGRQAHLQIMDSAFDVPGNDKSQVSRFFLCHSDMRTTQALEQSVMPSRGAMRMLSIKG